MKVQEVNIQDFGGAPFAEHNYPCPIYREQHAVFNIGHSYFSPSWKAQKEGWHLVKFNTWFLKFIFKWVLKNKVGQQ